MKKELQTSQKAVFFAIIAIWQSLCGKVDVSLTRNNKTPLFTLFIKKNEL